MAGQPGKSGGARAGAGRKPKPPNLSTSTALLTKDPKDFLVAVMNDPATEMKTRTDAAKALMPFMHKKVGEVGKREETAAAAKKAANKFAVGAPPKLVVNNRK
jgi:phage terminase small subunit